MTTAHDLAYVRKEEEPILAPPRHEVGAIKWMRTNLFSSATNTALTIFGILFLLWTVPPLINWAFISAVWTGDSREDCIVPGAGACWAYAIESIAETPIATWLEGRNA